MNTANQPTMQNGVAMAAFLAAAIGALGIGVIVFLNALGAFPLPTLYSPSGGVSTRTTLAVIVWLAIWLVLHRRWKDRSVEPKRVRNLSLLFIGLGILLVFPPLWNMF